MLDTTAGATAPPVFATEAILLSPSADSTAPSVAAWPLFVFIVPDHHIHACGAGSALVELLDSGAPVRLLDRPAHWSVLSESGPLLRLALRGTTPTPWALDIGVAAAALGGKTSLLATGATIGVTTSSRSTHLDRVIGVGDALRHLVLARCEPAAELLATAQAIPTPPRRPVITQP